MGLFRPARTVIGPSGERWEIYVSKTALPSWRQGRGGVDVDFVGGRGAALDLLELPLALLSAVWGLVVVPLFRFTVLLPFAFVRGRRSRAVRIEAVNAFPVREVLLWTTTDGLVDGVLDEIATGLMAGKVVQPTGAVYSGAENG